MLKFLYENAQQFDLELREAAWEGGEAAWGLMDMWPASSSWRLSYLHSIRAATGKQ